MDTPEGLIRIVRARETKTIGLQLSFLCAVAKAEAQDRRRIIFELEHEVEHEVAHFGATMFSISRAR